MGLRKDFSVVADSEMASSPSKSSPAPIKRSAKTYGRRRDDADTSFTYSEQDSRDSIYRTAPPNMSDEVPPSEPSKLLDSDDEEEGDDDDDVLPSSLVQPRFTFGWKEKLRQLDNEEYLNEHPRPQGATKHTPLKETVFLPLYKDTDVDSPVKDFGGWEPTSDGAFDNAPPSITLLSRHNISQESATRPSRNWLRTRKNMIKSDDDMDSGNKRDSRPSSPQTPPPHPIATPKSHFTSSPPTSHHDDVSANSTESSASRKKGKGPGLRRSVAPFQFDSHAREGFDDLQNATRPRSALSRRKEKKVKPPTKKERQEIVRERARMAVEQEVSIEKTAIPERSLRTLFNKLGHQKGLLPVDGQHAEPAIEHLTSPVDSFSSSESPPYKGDGPEALPTSNTRKLAVTTPGLGPFLGRAVARGGRLVPEAHFDLNAQTGVNVLDCVGDSEELKQQGIVARRQALSQMKAYLLSKQKGSEANDDHELEVIKPTELEQQRRAEKKMSQGERMLTANARVRNKPLLLDPRKATHQDLTSVREAILKQGTSDPHLLKLLLRQQAEEESLSIVRQKEREWKRLGGVARRRHESESMEDAQRNQIRKGLEVWTKGGRNSGPAGEDADGDVNEENDVDWSPEVLGLTPQHEDEEVIDYEKIEMGEMDEQMPKERYQEINDKSKAKESEDENKDVPVFKTKTKNHLRSRVVDSDESDSGDYNNENAMLSKLRDLHYVISSSDDRTEDENDKENDTRLMFDRSEDKENKAVVRHRPLTGPSLSLDTIPDDTDHDLSLSPPYVMGRELVLETESRTQSLMNPSEKRKPLGVLSDTSPMTLHRQPSGLTQAFAAQLRHSSSPTRGLVEDGDIFSSAPSAPGTSLDFAPLFGDRGARERMRPALEFSQEGAGLMGFDSPAMLQPGLSDLFDSSTQKAGEDAAHQGLQRQESLDLTQDLVLQPAFQVDKKLLRKADVIFEKEQEYVVETVSKKGVKEQEFYVNDVGLLTQTRPSASGLGTRSPSFVLSPTQTRGQQPPGGLGFTETQTDTERCASQTQPRPPLRTISLSNPQLSSPEANPKRRLRKRGETPTPRGLPIHSPSRSGIFISTSPVRQLSVFDVLGKALPKAKDKGKGKETAIGKIVRREWLAEEAEESDEDQMAGFGFAKKLDGEEDEDGDVADLDGVLPELVDDQKMDKETEGADRVLEKHKALLEQDDEAALKFHQGVVEGELRKKRKNRFGLDDSDEEDEEDDRARRIRRRMREKVERGDIKQLAANEKTAAFANVYQTGLIDDGLIETRPLDFELDFRVGRELEDEDTVMDDSQSDEREDQDAVDAKDEEEDNRNRYVTYQDIRAEVRKMNEQPKMDVPDYEDVSWIDKQDDDEMEADSVKIRVVTSHSKKPGASAVELVAGWDSSIIRGGIRRKENEKDLERSRAWARNEVRNMTGSTGRVVGSIAVTGHGNSGGGSLRSAGTLALVSSASSSLSGMKALRAEGSVLAGIAKRKEHFQ